MIITIIGLFHLIHSPVLILLPFYIKNSLFDMIYINYFFLIMISYTFLNGECPISYTSKLMLNNNYIAGENICYYPEMLTVLPNNKCISYYFGAMTGLYMFSLFYVIYRSNILLCIYLLIPFFTLLIYFLFIHNILLNKRSSYFIIFQKITKYVLCFSVLFIIKKYTEIL